MERKRKKQMPSLPLFALKYDKRDILPKQRFLFLETTTLRHFQESRKTDSLKMGRGFGVLPVLVSYLFSVQGSLGSSVVWVESENVTNQANLSLKQKRASREVTGLFSLRMLKKVIQKWTYFSEDNSVLSAAACPRDRKQSLTGTLSAREESNP